MFPQAQVDRVTACRKEGQYRLSHLVWKSRVLSWSKLGAQVQIHHRDSRRTWHAELLCRWSGAQKASNQAAYTGDEAISQPGKTHQGQRCGVGRGFRQSQRRKENFLPTKEHNPAQIYHISWNYGLPRGLGDIGFSFVKKQVGAPVASISWKTEGMSAVWLL